MIKKKITAINKSVGKHDEDKKTSNYAIPNLGIRTVMARFKITGPYTRRHSHKKSKGKKSHREKEIFLGRLFGIATLQFSVSIAIDDHAGGDEGSPPKLMSISTPDYHKRSCE